jgi:hypothetical protein
MSDSTDAQNPSPGAPEPTAGRRRLTAREQAIFEELSLLDPELAGLFERGIAELQGPPNPYVLAHIGRELNRGVIAALTAFGTAGPAPTPDDIPEGELDLGVFAAALGMPIKHPLVKAWQRNYRDLVRCAHYRRKKRPPPTREEVEPAFRTLQELLFGRIAPYFQTQRELENLLAIDTPSSADLDRLKPVLLRPPQRVYFFRKLDHVGWLRPLLEAGFFSTPPDATSDARGRWGWMGWPEGDYLVRMAARDPELVFRALMGIPRTLRNPVVWYNAAQAALELSPELSAQLVPQFLEALDGPIRFLFPEGLVDLAIKLARSGKSKAAFKLGEKLTQLNVREGDERSAIAAAFGHNDVGMRFFDRREIEERIPRLIEGLEAADPRRCLILLARRLGSAIRAHRTAGESPDDPNDHSWAWCDSLVDPEDLPRDVRTLLLKAMAGVAYRLAERGSREAESALAVLRRVPFDAFRRVELHVLHAAGAAFPVRIDALLGDKELIVDDRLGSREYGPLVAKFFGTASPDAQQRFVEVLTAGPDRSEVTTTLERWNRSVTDEGIEDFVRSWQARRLAWFGDAVPDALRALADLARPIAARIAAEEATVERRLLRTAPVSPFTVDQLRAMSPADIRKVVQEWAPQPDEEATDDGLSRALVDVVAADPVQLGGLLTDVQGDSRAGYVAAVLEGLVQAVDKAKPLPWPEVISLVRFTVSHTELSAEKRERDLWRWAKRQAVRLLQQSAAKDLIPVELADAVWEAVEIVHGSNETWILESEPAVEKEVDSFYGVLSHSLNARSGEGVELALVVALWNYRKAKAGSAIITDPRRVLPLLEHALTIEGKPGDAGRVVIGKYLPQITLLDRKWPLRHSAALFIGQLGGPDWDRVWGGYLTGARLYDDTFPVLRPIYARSASSLTPVDTTKPARDRDFSPNRSLVVHTISALIRGLARRGEDDHLIEQVFDRADLSDLAHAYWSLFRGFSETKTVAQAMLDRLVELWKWRLTELEKSATPQSVAEAGGLGWLFLIDPIPDDLALELLNRSAQIATSGFEMAHSLWGRLARVSAKNPSVALDIAAQLIDAELKGEYPHFNRQEIGAVLDVGVRAGGVVQKKAERLVNKLGDAGFSEFGELLP